MAKHPCSYADTSYYEVVIETPQQERCTYRLSPTVADNHSSNMLRHPTKGQCSLLTSHPVCKPQRAATLCKPHTHMRITSLTLIVQNRTTMTNSADHRVPTQPQIAVTGAVARALRGGGAVAHALAMHHPSTLWVCSHTKHAGLHCRCKYTVTVGANTRNADDT